MDDDSLDLVPWEDFLDELDQTAASEKVSKMFLRFVKELWHIPGMPDNMWPVAVKFAGMLHDGLGDLVEVERRESVKKACKKAGEARHKPLQEFKEKAVAAARAEWANGSSLLHHQMAKYLTEEYRDETGKYPFTNLPGKSKSSPEKVLCRVCKEVALGIGQPDLVFGLYSKKK